MQTQKSFLIAVICLFLGFIATISLAQEAPDEFLTGVDAGSGAKLVVTSVSGPATAIHNQTISVTYTVKNLGDEASSAYNVGLYLSTDNTIDPAADRLVEKVTFSPGLVPGQSRRATSEVLVPINDLSGKYYFGAVVASSSMASSKRVSLVRYSLGDNNETVTDHKTGSIWQRADDGNTRKWADAKQYCADLVLASYEDWRLPRIDELQTIVDYSQKSPAINPVFDCRVGDYWSGSSLAGDLSNAWTIWFEDGDADWGDKASHYSVRCVRGGP